MSDKSTLHTAPPAIEVERYELNEPSQHHFDLQRRDFFKALGAGLLVACVLKDALAFQESGGGRRRGFGEEALPREISAWLHIGENGTVTSYTGKVEIGQNIRTSLSQALAEELRFPIERIELVMGDTKLTPFDMGTFGSRTTPTMNLQLRRVASAARDALVEMAAKQWNANAQQLVAADGKITDPATKRTIEYAELVRGQQLTALIPTEDPLEPATEWKVEGQPISKVNGRDFVTGKHKYPSDQKLPGMLYGKVLRPPSFGATLVAVNAPDATLMSEVTFVHDGDFVGVAGPSEEAATRALKSVRAEWKEQTGQPSSETIYDYLKKNPAQTGGEFGERTSDFELGSMESGMSSADHRLQQTYTVAYIAHTPLEPRAALAQWSGDNLTVWTGTQRPFGVRGQLAQAFHLPEEKVRVLMPDMGSGYGGKHTGECAIEAARLARAANRPVKLIWTREEEFTWAYFRPAGVIDVSAGARNDGTITAWEFHNYNSGGSGIRTMYEVPNQRIVFHPTEYPLRQGSYRALAATANHFARESFMDELAHEVNMDPLAFRMKNLKNERLRAVFEAGAKKFGWGQTKRPGHGFGMGGGFEKGGNVATFAEVAVDRGSGNVQVVRVVSAFECGAIVNPDGLRNQIEGGNIMGMGGALFEAIRFADGKILNPHLAQYRVPRFKDVPQMETVLIDRRDIPSAGAGESPLMGVAPAIGNAIFDATGVRLRSMPMVPNGLKAS
ncbi:MAG TPA: molybdopterin cofactor-binding domain-containing protein [Candidatus Acidoferrales bacterium]|nr:molybdopterin cofactor-binding domain-containing protein [Candidatus Acidoferrales bacterium]